MLREIAVRILRNAGIEVKEADFEIPSEKFGDLAYPCFNLAKRLCENPVKLAEEYAKKIKNEFLEKVEAKNGYINLYFDFSKISRKLLKEILNKQENFGKIKGRKVAVIDYSSPNPAHPIHVGSARSTFIGESLARILSFNGYKVKRICYINDLGKQIAILIFGYQKFAKNKKPNKKPDHWLLDIYVKANQEIANEPSLEKDVEKILYLYENGNEKIKKIAEKLVNLCIKGFKETYKVLGIKFDEYLWESKFVKISKKYVEELLKKKKAFKAANGAIIADLKEFNLPNTVLIRSDGTGLYLTRDIAASIYKYKKYKPNLNIFVVSEDQKLHFQQQFKLLEILGYKKLAESSVHIGYGYVSLPEGKMSSRLGRVVLIDDVINEAIEKIKEEIEKRKVVKNKKEIERIAKVVGISAIIYAILRIEANKQIKFEIDKVLSFEGNTGTYLQYAHTRCASILRKAKRWKKVFSVKNISKEEKNLIKNLARFKEVLKESAKELNPSLICSYAYELATSFSNFYQACPILKLKDEKRKNFRLTLVKATKIVLKISLNLMGVEAVEKM